MAKLTERERGEFLRLSKEAALAQSPAPVLPLGEYLRALSSMAHIASVARITPQAAPPPFPGSHWKL
jgi:hypothetical protein